MCTLINALILYVEGSVGYAAEYKGVLGLCTVRAGSALFPTHLIIKEDVSILI